MNPGRCLHPAVHLTSALARLGAAARGPVDHVPVEGAAHRVEQLLRGRGVGRCSDSAGGCRTCGAARSHQSSAFRCQALPPPRVAGYILGRDARRKRNPSWVVLHSHLRLLVLRRRTDPASGGPRHFARSRLPVRRRAFSRFCEERPGSCPHRVWTICVCRQHPLLRTRRALALPGRQSKCRSMMTNSSSGGQGTGDLLERGEIGQVELATGSFCLLPLKSGRCAPSPPAGGRGSRAAARRGLR